MGQHMRRPSRRTRPGRYNWLLRLGLLLVCADMVNFVAFVIVGPLIGGHAFGAEIVAGQHYLATRGGCVPVSPEVYRFAHWHMWSVWATHVGLIPGGVLYFIGAMRKRDSRLLLAGETDRPKVT